MDTIDLTEFMSSVSPVYCSGTSFYVNPNDVKEGETAEDAFDRIVSKEIETMRASFENNRPTRSS